MATASLSLNGLAQWFKPEMPTWDQARNRSARVGAALRPFVVHFSGADAVDRTELEQFVRDSFGRAYGAEVKHFMPLLMSLRSHSGDLLAVCGLRHAENQRLFLETYMDQPVETVLSQRTGQMVERCDVIEIGNLAVASAGFSRHLIGAIVEHVYATDLKWAVFTAVPALRNASNKLGIHLEWLCAADKNRLNSGERSEWGNYYSQNPQVMAVGRVPQRELFCLPSLK